MKKLSFLAILLVLCVAGWAQGPDNATPSDQPQGQQGMGQRVGRRGPGVAGEVTAINGNTITVKTMNGNTTTVNVTDQMLERADGIGQLAAISKAQAVLELALDGTVLAANPNFLATFGYSLEEVCEASRDISGVLLVGAPLRFEGRAK